DHHHSAAAWRSCAGHRVTADRHGPGEVSAGPCPRPELLREDGRHRAAGGHRADGRDCADGRQSVSRASQHATPQERIPQVTGELIAIRRAGAYHHLTFVAPGVAELARPGQFVALAVGGDTSANLLRRCFSIHKVSPSGTYGGTVDIVV